MREASAAAMMACIGFRSCSKAYLTNPTATRNPASVAPSCAAMASGVCQPPAPAAPAITGGGMIGGGAPLNRFRFGGGVASPPPAVVDHWPSGLPPELGELVAPVLILISRWPG